MTYKLVNNTDGITKKTTEADIIIRKTDNAAIPKDPENSDYQEYLEWVSKGNTAEEAD